jgi:GWxTD domain-containing protein
MTRSRLGFDPSIGMVPYAGDFYHAMAQLVATTTQQSFEVAGEATYLKSTYYLERAYELRPEDDRIFRALAVTYLGRDRWVELQRLAQDRTIRAAHDPWSWLALALAQARLGEIANAREAMTRGLALLRPEERDRLDRIERVLAPDHAAQFRLLSPADRERSTAAQWFLADPLWSSDDEDPRLEFVVRVVYAELRWGAEGEGRHGVDSDRGRVHIRYGPPDKIIRITQFPGGAGDIVGSALLTDEFRDIKLGHRPAGGIFYGGTRSQNGEIIPPSSTGALPLAPPAPRQMLFWLYDQGLLFAFPGLRYLSAEDVGINEHLFATQPARFDNIAVVRVDSMPTQAVRFRAGTDSVELFVATRSPLQQLREAAAVGTSIMATNWVYGRTVPDAFRDSLPLTENGVLTWTRRLRAGDYLWRAEVTAKGLLAAGRSTIPLTLRDDAATGFTLRGAGISDILLGTSLTDVSGAESWRETNVTPLLGSLRGQRTVALVWETYDLASEAATSRYDVVVQVSRVRGRADRVVASVVGALASVAGIDRNEDGVAIRYSRTTAAAPVLVEQLTIDLGATPPGEYVIVVQVRDAIGGSTLTRTTRITVE